LADPPALSKSDDKDKQSSNKKDKKKQDHEKDAIWCKLHNALVFLSFLLDEALELEFEADESFVDVVLAEWLNELEK
jgi:hypothetical protein